MVHCAVCSTREMKSFVVKSDNNPIWRGYEEVNRLSVGLSLAQCLVLKVWRWVPANIGVMDDLFFELEVN